MYQPLPIVPVIRLCSLVAAVDEDRPAHFYFAGEMHDFWELVYIRSGKLTATADERVYNLESGKLLFHKPMEFHRLWNSEPTDAHVQILSFETTGEGMEGFRNTLFSLSPEERMAFERLTEQFKTALAVKDTPDFSYHGQMAAAAMECFLLSLCDRTPDRMENLSADERQYRRIVQVMKEHIEESLSVEQLATRCHMSVSNMKRIFGRFCDRGIAKYFSVLKMRRAAELLSEGKTPKQVAAQLGFADPTYFYTVFKRDYGQSPTEYRRKLSDKIA